MMNGEKILKLIIHLGNINKHYTCRLRTINFFYFTM